MYINLINYHFNFTGESCSSNLGAMVEVIESPLNSPASEVESEILNSLKPKLMRALEENSYVSELHKTLDQKSKYTRFNDIITLHPSTSVHYSVKEKVAHLVSEWYKEYLETQFIEISEAHKRDYPLAVLFPVALEYISNSEIITVESDEEKNSNPEPAPNPDVFQECSVCSNSEMVNLCPIWQGEYNNILHHNTCSIDNIISFISLYRETIEEARRIIDISLNPDAQHFFHWYIGASLTNSVITSPDWQVFL